MKPRLPRGFVDQSPSDIRALQRMLHTIRSTFELYGFEALETPFVEFTEALGKFLPDLDRPNEGVFSFHDDDESWLSLRYDLTAPLARYVAEHFDAIPKPYRSYRSGYVFRNEKPGPGRFRQFLQFDADIVGTANVIADAEICMMAADTLDRLGLDGKYTIKINNRKILDGVLETTGLEGDDKAGQRLITLRAIDKLDRLGVDGVRNLLGPGRRDESGDYTKGAGLPDGIIEHVLAYASHSVPRTGQTGSLALWQETSAAWSDVVGSSETGRQGIAELDEILTLCIASGYECDRIRADASIVRGLEYYTGPVYEADLTSSILGDDGRPIRFGAVASGGRYDGLVGRFRSEPVPATGFSIGVSRLLSALQVMTAAEAVASNQPGPVVVLVLDRDEPARYQNLASTLRNAGIAAEVYLGSSGLKAQMKYADRRGAPVAIIQGSSERDAGEVQIKDLVEGAKAADSIASNAEWKASRPAQFSAPVSEMVEQVRTVLARHFR